MDQQLSPPSDKQKAPSEPKEKNKKDMRIKECQSSGTISTTASDKDVAEEASSLPRSSSSLTTLSSHHSLSSGQVVSSTKRPISCPPRKQSKVKTPNADSHKRKSKILPPPPPPSSLADYNPKKATKKRQSKGLFDTFFKLFDKPNQARRESKNARSSNKVEELSEDQEAEQRKIKSAHQETIPVFRTKEDKDETSLKHASPTKSSEDRPLPNDSIGIGTTKSGVVYSNNESPSVEEDSDGYNSAKHIEQLINDFSSQSLINLSKSSSSTETSNDYLVLEFEEENVGSDGHDSRSSISRSERRARILFDPRLLGRDEKEYNETRFKTVVRKAIPDQIPIPSKLSQPRNREPRKINCGSCKVLKTWIGLTLVISVSMYLITDSCFTRHYYRLSKVQTTQSPLHKRVKMSTIGHKPKTMPNGINSAYNVLNFSSITSPFDRSLKNTKTTISRSDHFATKQDYQVIPIEDESIKYCSFKHIFIVIMSTGVPVYVFIFVLYTCRMVVRFHKFPWFLLETILLFLYSLALLTFSVLAFFMVEHQKIANSLALIDSIFGLMIAFWTYRKYALGTDPFTLLSGNETDLDEITQILARRQIQKLFTLGQRKASNLSSQSTNKNHKDCRRCV